MRARRSWRSWRGKPFTRDDEMGFDVEKLIGANCLLNVQHKVSTKDPNRVFANVVSVMPLLKGMPKLIPLDYQRPAVEPEPEPPAPIVNELGEDEIPF